MVINMENSPIWLSLVVLLPLLGSVISYLVGRVVPRLSGVVASFAVGVAFVATLVLSQGLQKSGPVSSTLSSWLSFGSHSMPLDLYFDSLSSVMCLIITGVGFLIHLYSIGYMAEDESKARFFAYLNLFVASMLVLVLGKSLPVIFIGWEGVGLCSYLLIGFWFTNPEYASAGRKAFVMNRIGDVGFLIAMAVLYTVCGTLDVTKLSDPSVLTSIPVGLGSLAGLMLFVAATGKSAQIPLFTWLPDAMAGPTPVSALIHAATMVTAGIYLMGRMHGVVELDPLVPAIILCTALATAAVAATIALVQNDIKKVLAYSTVSQLGFMFLAVGVGQYAVALFHVVTHAFFKACLFLSAGSVIHGCHHEQDMRHMGGLGRMMPVTCFCYGVATLAIAGVYPLSGYFSKHAILGAIATTHNPFLSQYSSSIGMCATLIAVCTAFYMTRSFIMTFMGRYRGSAHPHEAPLVMTLPVVVLAILSIVGGIALNSSLLSYVAGPLPVSHGHEESSGLLAHLVASLPGVAGIVMAYVLLIVAPGMKDGMRAALKPLERLFVGRYFVDELFDLIVVRPVRGVARVAFRSFDLTLVEGSGNALGSVTRAVGELTCRLTTGQVATYLLFMFAAVALMCGVFVHTR